MLILVVHAGRSPVCLHSERISRCNQRPPLSPFHNHKRKWNQSVWILAHILWRSLWYFCLEYHCVAAEIAYCPGGGTPSRSSCYWEASLQLKITSPAFQSLKEQFQWSNQREYKPFNIWWVGRLALGFKVYLSHWAVPTRRSCKELSDKLL